VKVIRWYRYKAHQVRRWQEGRYLDSSYHANV